MPLKDEAEIINKFKAKRVKIEFRDVGKIALGIYGRCPDVAREFLGIKVDTAQILAPDVFSSEYSATGFSTPLNNTFLFREEELKNLLNSLQNNVITILTGPPGVGKSRLALAAFESFKSDKKNKYVFYCISNKNAPIYDDLRSYLLPDKNFLILIDDANRQTDNLMSILPILKEKRKGTIKIIITVRDYAYEDTKERSNEFNPQTIDIKKFTDEQLTEILKSEDFKITNPDYYRRILEIADGNPRIAIMAALLAKEKQTLHSLQDMSELYDQYFSEAIKDKSALTDNVLLKTMGILSFFYSLDRSNRVFCDPLLKHFNLDYYKFNEAIDKLERLELLETSADYAVVKVSEQVLSTYFFYKAFFKDNILDFSVILNNYFDDYHYRITDTVIPANNTFGYQNVYSKITPHLDAFWKKIKNSEERAFKFLDLFWFYRHDDVFSFIDKKIKALRVPAKANYIVKEDNKINPSLDKDKYIELLTGYFHSPNPSDEYLIALELGFEYTRRNPNQYSEFIKKLYDGTVFTYEDQKARFYRQRTLIDYLISKTSSKNKFYQQAFLDIAPKYMRTSYNVVTSARQRNAIRFYDFTLPFIDEIRDLRKKVWETLIKLFPFNKELSLEFLYSYMGQSIHKVKEIYIYDLDYLITLSNTHFSTANFEHCYIVNDLNYRFKKLEILDSRMTVLSQTFRNPTYKLFRVLDKNRLKDKESFEFENWQEYERLKEEEQKRELVFKDVKTFKAFYKELLFLNQWRYGNHSDLLRSLDTVLENSLQINFNLGLEFLKEIICQKNSAQFAPWKPFDVIFRSALPNQIEEFHSFLLTSDFESKENWLLRFYKLLPEDLVLKVHAQGLLKLYREMKQDLQYSDVFSYISKFERFEKNINKKMLEVIVKHNEEGKIKIKLDYDFFEKYIDKFINSPQLLKKAYLQQDKLFRDFDHDLKDFIILLELDNSFLFEYIKFIFKDRFSISARDNHLLSSVWRFPNAESQIIQILDFVVKKNLYSVEEHFANAFFKQLNNSHKERALKLITSLMKKKSKDREYLNMIFDIIRHSFKNDLAHFIKLFLSLNSGLETFQKISWLDNWFSSNGETIWSDVRRSELEFILRTVEEIKVNSYKYGEHKEYLRERIQQEQRASDYERRERFMESRW